eukprot:TRINITY_DN56140_c0_g1_i1.p1 TRINITY_DN56140_c0_g1~~TRINITY_DN56140_c0_g1_i1.p1  ORF type:complete len:130 (-),score=23.84 TRINITY_DN56140_c0_g1_i1:10-399(-)
MAHEFVNLLSFVLFDKGFMPMATDCLMDSNCCANRAMRAMDVGYSPGWWNTKSARIGEIPSSNGITNSLSLAKMAALIVNGGKFEEKRLLDKKTLEKAMGDHDTRIDASEIGRAVQQECRDRSRMPSSA